VALSVETIGQMPDTSDINCRNYVSISPGTLSEMEQNPALKKKILQEIEEFCSPKNQAYPTEIGSEKSEKKSMNCYKCMRCSDILYIHGTTIDNRR
jgi:hypothetical protein